MDFDKYTKLTDFAKERDVPNNTIVKYITRHAEDFNDHIIYDTANNNAMYLDDEAVKMLSQKYRITTQIITDNDLYQQVMKLTEIVIEMHKEKEQTPMIADKQLEERIEMLEKENAMLRQKQEDDEILRLEADNLRMEQRNMIDESYLKNIIRIHKLKAENRKK